MPSSHSKDISKFCSQIFRLICLLPLGSGTHNGSTCNGKVSLKTDHEVPKGEEKYSSTLSLTSAIDSVGGQHHALSALPPVKTRCPSYGRLGGPQGRSERVRKISPPQGFDPRTVQLIASHYTD